MEIKPFRQVLSDRRAEAQRSLLIQVQSDQSCEDLYQYCSEFGSVQTMFHYKTTKNMHYVLVEMESQPIARKILSNASHLDPLQAIPVTSPFLWFKVPIKKKNAKNSNKFSFNINRSNELEAEPKKVLLESLEAASSVTEQISLLLKRTEVNELGTRLRFLTAQQMEMGLGGLFRDMQACPFGSSVNGFGKNGCDLDLVLVFPENQVTDSRLVFHAKACSPDDRLQIQNHIELLGDIMSCLMPGCTSVKKITQARVPIVKYKHELTNLDCDISLYNTTCLQMSEILYLLGSMDIRVRELVMTVRAWAKEIGLTNPSPGRWISNFSLSLLVLFFLQQSSMKILPPLQRLRHRNYIMTNEEFLSYSSKLLCHRVDNKMKTEDILIMFFQFYATFDFGSNGLNLLSGKTVVKPDYSAMFIVNPIEPELNVSKNVSAEETERLQNEMRNATWMLEASTTSAAGKNWGLVKLLSSTAQRQTLSNTYSRSRSRLVDVKSLFDG